MKLPRKILVAPASFGMVDAAPLEVLRKAGFEVVCNSSGKTLSADDIKALLPGVVGIISGLERLSEEVLEGTDVTAISRSGAGVSNIDMAAARRLGIAVTNTPDAPTSAVAELTLCAMLTLLRHVIPMSHALHEGQWARRVGRQLEGRRVVIVGLGRIGRRVAELLLAFRASVVAVDPHVNGAETPVPLLSLQEAIPLADIITLHASGEDRILGRDELFMLPRDTLVLNGGRGGLVDEVALCEALDASHVAGAWVDTFGTEPYAGPLLRYPQVILTPHIGSLTIECRRRMEMEAAENLLQSLGAQSTNRMTAERPR